MACHSGHENITITGFQPLVDRLHSFSNMEDSFDISKMKDYLQGNVDDYKKSCTIESNCSSRTNNVQTNVADSTQNNIADSTQNNILNGSTCTNNSSQNVYNNNINRTSLTNETNTCSFVEPVSMEEDDCSSNRNESEDDIDGDELFIDDDGDNGDDGGSDSMSDNFKIEENEVSYTKSSDSEVGNENSADENNADPHEAVLDQEDIADENNKAEEFSGLQKDNGIYTGSRQKENSQVMVGECDSTSPGTEFSEPRTLATGISNCIQLGDTACGDSVESKYSGEPSSSNNSSTEQQPKKERWTMKIKVGNASDGSRCEIIKHVDYEDAKKGGLIRDNNEQLNDNAAPHNSMADTSSSVYPSLPPANDIKMLVGKRKKEKKSWNEDDISMTDLGAPAKKTKGGLRSDCPPFCKTNCTKIHHPLLVSARRMIENDSNTTIMFLEQVARYYGGDLGELMPATEIQDPYKDTCLPLLHYLALMGKCSGCFALVDSGQSPSLAITSNGDSVVHTLVREMYNFNCTHGHMDILLKKFTILLKEFRVCLTIENYVKETPFHLIGKLITGTALLLNVPGRNKLPYRLYQFAKNMLRACLEQFVNDKLGPEVLNRQDTLGNTVSHYIARDRASLALLDILVAKGADFSIRNSSQQNIEDLKLMAPPAPNGEILEMAEYSAKSNKYKKDNRKKLVQPSDLPAVKKELTAEQTTENFMEMLNSKLSTSEWEPIEKIKEKKKVEKKSKVSSLLSAAASLDSLPPFEELASRTSSTKNVDQKTSTFQECKSRTQGGGIVSTSQSCTSAPLPSCTPLSSTSTAIADVTSTCANTLTCKTVFIPKVVKIEKPDDPGYGASCNPVSDISIIDKLTNLSNSIKPQMTAIVTPTIMVTSHNQPYPPRLSHIAVPNVRPVASVPPASAIFHPPNTNMQNLARDVSMQQNIFMFRPPPHGPPLLTQQHPRTNMNPTLQNIAPRPPPPLQAANVSTGVTQPLLLKTGDGKLMSINVVQVSKMNNTQVNSSNSNNNNNNNNTSWNQQVTSMPPLLNVHPQIVSQPQRPPHYIDPNLRYITPAMVNNSFRPHDHNTNSLNVPSTQFTNSHVPRLQHPTLLPNTMIPHSYQGVTMHNMNSMQNPTNLNILSQTSLIHNLIPSQPLNTAFQNTNKYDPKKNRGLEASIENLRYSAMNLVPNTITNITHKNKSKNRLGSSVKSNSGDSAPRVIILDEVSTSKAAPDTRELQSPSIESSQSSQDLDSPQFRDLDGVASFMKNYLQEKGSIEDFVKFSNEKKEGLVKKHEDEGQKIQGINKEISVRESDIKNTREQVVNKEMEIAHLRLKLTKLQNDINQLRTNRQNVSECQGDIEKRMKSLEEQTNLFTSWNTEGRCDR